MIFGCPDRFSIYYDLVKCWSTNSFHEGVVGFYIKNKIFPLEFYDYVVTLDINLKEIEDSLLRKESADNQLFYENKLKLTRYLLKSRYPSNVFTSETNYKNYPDYLYEDEELRYSVDVEFLRRARLAMFIVKHKEKARLLILNFDYKGDFFNLENLRDHDIHETIISCKELRNIVEESILYYNKHLNRFN